MRKKIKLIMLEKSVTQAKIARDLGMSQSDVSKLLRSERRLNQIYEYLKSL